MPKMKNPDVSYKTTMTEDLQFYRDFKFFHQA